MKRLLTAWLLASLAMTPAADAADTPLGAVETFFDAMSENDWQRASTVMIGDAVLYGYRIQDGQVWLGRLTVDEYLETWADRDDRLLERIWDVKVLEDDRLATVWTPYDFFLNGEFHHCGTNSFSLIRDESGWRIAGVVYSILTDECEPSPLGPPEFD